MATSCSGSVEDNDKPMDVAALFKEKRMNLAVEGRKEKAKDQEKIQIHVKSLANGKTTTYEVESCETILKLKAMIREKEDIPQNKLRLIFGVKQLEPGRTLEDYNIMDQSVLHMVPCLCGC